MDIFGNFNKIGKVKSDLADYEYQDENNSKGVLEEDEKEKPSFGIFYFAIFILAFLLIIKLVNLQITQNGTFAYLAEGNRIRTKLTEAPRGIIYDKTGAVLAKNNSTFALQIYPADLPKDAEAREKIYSLLKDNSNIDINDLKNKIDKQGLYSLEPIILIDNLSRDDALAAKVKYANCAGVVVADVPLRQYDTTVGLSHILGYIGKINEEELKENPTYNLTDKIGKIGLEKTYESMLKGIDGKEQVEVDSTGAIQRIMATINSIPGNSLYTTIDLGLQKKLAEVLQKASGSDKNAVAVAMDPQTGGILALVSLPSYDNNIFSKSDFSEDYQKLLDDPNNPLLNRVTDGQYPSGSTIKPFVAAAGLQEGVINESTTINDTGSIKIGDWEFPDWKVHGLTDVKKAIAQSCDVFFYAVGGGWDKIKGLGVEKLKEYLNKFGFGSITNIDLSSEAKGLVPDPDWKEEAKNESWYLGDTYHMSIGQGDLEVTPLQLVAGLSLIANGGKLLQPHLMDKIVDVSGKTIETFGTKVVRDSIISDDNMRIVREGMRQTNIDGSGRLLAALKDKNGNDVTSAGKTGTAEFGTDDKTHSWYTCFAPYDNPNIALVILVEGGGEGNEVSLPVAKEVLDYWFNR